MNWLFLFLPIFLWMTRPNILDRFGFWQKIIKPIRRIKFNLIAGCIIIKNSAVASRSLTTPHVNRFVPPYIFINIRKAITTFIRINELLYWKGKLLCFIFFWTRKKKRTKYGQKQTNFKSLCKCLCIVLFTNIDAWFIKTVASGTIFFTYSFHKQLLQILFPKFSVSRIPAGDVLGILQANKRAG